MLQLLLLVTLTAGVACARAGATESTATPAAAARAAATRGAEDSVQSTGGGYVQAGGACYRSWSRAARPLGQKARKSQRRHHGPAVVG